MNALCKAEDLVRKNGRNNCVNHLCPCLTNSSRNAKISILK